MEFRNARHTDNLKLIEEFYTNIIGLKVLFSFENHNNYNGVFIGKEGHNWHLEFTASNIKAEHKFDIEDVLVFYPTERDEYDKIVGQIETNNIEKIKSRNPFWNDNGIMIQDPDGFGVIVSNLKIK
ncbi:VOC family protein [Lutimonas halocynthiae]|uniref:VOC family protein n=1 Tax=Lutimonas halocynthiae TaxID=1446477 RepID=UPI0025B3B334|nr:VOC family protein [Lutimonas halocynthiae]MDN3643243.1 VOC family protein [Lutimonas halocynthiae]